MMYEILGRTLKVSTTQSDMHVEFEWPIAEVIQCGEAFVVRTEPAPGSRDNRNICAVDTSGKIIWTVADRKFVYDDSPYTKIELVAGTLRLFNWDGLTLSVDPATWQEISAEYGR